MAWILEKFWAWTDCGGHPENVLTRDDLLDNVMLYWLTSTAASSARLYWESFRAIPTDPVTIPAGCSIFPKEIFRSSRRWAEHRYTKLIYFNELDKGGHFLVQQCNAGGNTWEVSRMSLSFTGKILLFKKLAIHSDEVFSDFRLVPSDTTFAQGVKILETEEVKLAQNGVAQAMKPAEAH